METKITKNNTSPKIVLGAVLVLIGLLLLASQWINFGAFILVLPGLLMLLLGIFKKEAGWIIPGAIVGSIGTAALVIENTAAGVLNETGQGAVFMLIFAGGWFLITLLTKFFTAQTHFWALIPGSIIACFGVLLSLGQPGLKILELTNYIWPIALVLGGGFIIIKSIKR